MDNTFVNILPAQYFASPALGSTQLKAWARSIGHGLTPSDISADAAAFGHCVHALVLENIQPLVMPKWDLRKTDHRDERQLWLDNLPDGANPVTPEHAEAAKAIQLAVSSYHPAAKLLEEGTPELSTFSELDAVQVKARADWLNGDTIVDLKTTVDSTYNGFQRAITQYKYHAQAALYLHLFGARHFYWIAVEKKAPWSVSVFKASAEMLLAGTKVIEQGLSNYKAYRHDPFLQTNYYDGVVDITLPKWADI